MISRLRVQNFRKHKDFSVDFKPGTTVITGTNGSGKTTLLEAIYIALQGKSWRSNFNEILYTNKVETADWWRIDVEFSNGNKRTIKYIDSAKIFEIEGKGYTRLPSRYKEHVVLFEPGDLQLISGSPARRRDFFDRFIAQVEPKHAAYMSKLERVLKQRNSLLKQRAGQDELFVWDVQFAEIAEKIIAARVKWVDILNEHLSSQYEEISTTSDTVAIGYTAPQKTSQQILNQLSSDFLDNWPYTKTGPQAHDFKFKINERGVKQTASRGEGRTMIFAILGAMTEAINKIYDQKVYLIFDDIDSELDDDRKKGLYRKKAFTDNYLFATTIKARGEYIRNHLSLN